MPSCQTLCEMVPQQRPTMPIDLYRAVIKGDADVLVPRLGLPCNHTKVQIDTSTTNASPSQIETEHQTTQYDLQSATHLGDTVLHLLVSWGHDELALKVFQKDMSLLKARNNKLETPLHCAARCRNENFMSILIQRNSNVVKEALALTNDNDDTAMHVAAKHGSSYIGHKLMKLDPEVAYKVNKEGSFPLQIAIASKFTMMAINMLIGDPTLACIQDSNGMFPVHVAARMGNKKLVNYIMEKYPDGADLLDPRGRNLFHIAAEENQYEIFRVSPNCRKIAEEMNCATDYEGNTPLHIAAMMEHLSIMQVIWNVGLHCHPESMENNQHLIPLQLYRKQLKKSAKKKSGENIKSITKLQVYIMRNGYKLTSSLFENVTKTSLDNRWDRVQVLGLGSVLIATVAFAAAFTIPGGYNQDNGTPVLARRYMFNAFIVANALAFMTALLSLLLLLLRSITHPGRRTLLFAAYLFIIASSCMVVAFGLGMYVTLAPNNMTLAILILAFSVFLSSPFVLFLSGIAGRILDFGFDIPGGCNGFPLFVASYGLIYVAIFCFAFL